VTYGGDSGNRIFVLYWRCSLISVSVIRGSTVFRNNLLHSTRYGEEGISFSGMLRGTRC
jgi:hypothetical protein